jgi:hypothetical protein
MSYHIASPKLAVRYVYMWLRAGSTAETQIHTFPSSSRSYFFPNVRAARLICQYNAVYWQLDLPCMHFVVDFKEKLLTWSLGVVVWCSHHMFSSYKVACRALDRDVALTCELVIHICKYRCSATPSRSWLVTAAESIVDWFHRSGSSRIHYERSIFNVINVYIFMFICKTATQRHRE